MTISNFSPSFAQASIVAPQTPPKTQTDIFKENTKIEAEKAKQKPKEERNLDDYVTIAVDTINKIGDNIPVIYADSPQKLNYLA